MLILKDAVESKNLVGFHDLTRKDIEDFYNMFIAILYSSIGPQLKSSGLLEPYKRHFLNTGQNPNLQPNIIRTMVLNLPPLQSETDGSVASNSSFESIYLGNNNSTSVRSINNASINSNEMNRFLNNNSVSGGFRKTRRRSKKSKRSRRAKRTRV